LICWRAAFSSLTRGTIDAAVVGSFEFWMIERPHVTFGARDTETEEVTDSAQVASGRRQLVDDPILAHDLRQATQSTRDPIGVDRRDLDCATKVDEHVRICRLWPPITTEVQVNAEPPAHGLGQHDMSSTDGEMTVLDVGQQDHRQLFAGYGVKGHQRAHSGYDRVIVREYVTDRAEIGWQGYALDLGPTRDADGRIYEDEFASLEHPEQGTQRTDHHSPRGPRWWQDGNDILSGDFAKRRGPASYPRPYGGEGVAEGCLYHPQLTRPHAGSSGASIAQHLDTDAQFALNHRRKPDQPSFQPSVEAGGTIVDQHSGRLEHGQYRIGWQMDAGEQEDVSGFDRRSRRVLDTEENPHAAASLGSRLMSPSVVPGMVGDLLVQEAGQTRVSRLGESEGFGGDEIRPDFEEHELTMGDR
jgi:hypothetical protein